MEFLLEISTEEMPPSHAEGALIQLRDSLAAELVAQNLGDDKKSYGKIQTYGTCRRLIIHGDFVPGQMDREAEILGPPKSIAFSQEGDPTPAAYGFAKSQGKDVKELVVIKTEKGEYACLKKIQKGKSTPEVLKNILPRLISRISFPKMMKWGESSLLFSRPIKNIFCLWEGRPLSFKVGDISSSDYTTGHRLFFPQKIKVRSFNEYTSQLKRHRVEINPESRKKRIERLMGKKLEPLEAQYYLDEELLNKVSWDVEYPYVFMGEFPEKYLKLPLDILSTAMKTGQSLFSVVKGRKQLPVFLGISDGCRDEKSLVKKGNERVLKARLDDASFFWNQDIKISLEERTKDLSRIVFQEKLGTYEEKTSRLKKITGYLAGKLSANSEKEHVVAAARLCKVDLLTEMVREFPSLQGKAGGLYAKREGYDALVWKAIYEHYQPVSQNGSVPSTLTGAILSLSDKLDTIVGMIGIGVTISGSSDPFGLRRGAQGVCACIIEKKLDFSFVRLLDRIIAIYSDRLNISRDKIKSICLELFKGRLQYIYKNFGFRYDIVNAALGAGLENIYHTYRRVQALDGLKQSSQFENLILIAKRVNNILRGKPLYRVHSELFVQKEERELYTTYKIIKDNVLPFIAKGEFAKTQRMVLKIGSSVNDYFDHVLVMEEDARIRRNRLAVLQAISKLMLQIADYSKVVIEGQTG